MHFADSVELQFWWLICLRQNVSIVDCVCGWLCLCFEHVFFLGHSEANSYDPPKFLLSQIQCLAEQEKSLKAASNVFRVPVRCGASLCQDFEPERLSFAEFLIMCRPSRCNWLAQKPTQIWMPMPWQKKS